MADINQVIRQLQQSVGFAASQAKQAVDLANRASGRNARIEQQLERQKNDLDNLFDAISAVKGQGSGGPNTNEHVLYIENLPGRRIPFDVVFEIPIGANVTSEQQDTATISQDGPFVAVARMATFLSQYEFERTDPETGQRASFQGRSFGRMRPVSSVWDLSDGTSGIFNPTAGIAFPGTGAPLYVSPSNHSGFRTMEFDGRFEIINQGAAYPRSDKPVPSAFLSDAINTPFQLGSMDFFERGEVIQVKVSPTHANNPAAGNLSAYAAGGTFPFLQSQYDGHEGINDQFDPDVTEDPVTRLPNGILLVVLHGFKIVQPPGPVRMT